MNRIYYVACVSLVGSFIFIDTASAGLLGSTVTGSLKFGGGANNYFDPVQGYVPAGFLNTSSPTVVIAEPAIEFGFQDGSNRDTANFTDTQLIVTDTVFSGAGDWIMSFTSAAFSSMTIAEISDTFPNGGVTGSLTGNSIKLSWAGTNSAIGTVTVTFSLVPEPATLSLAAIGGLALLARRRKSSGIGG